MYDFTCQLATLQAPPELQQVLGAVHGNQGAMDGFARMNAGTISPTEFFAPENIGPIMAAAASSPPCDDSHVRVSAEAPPSLTLGPW